VSSPDTGNDVVDSVLMAAHRLRRSIDTGLRGLGLSLSTFKLLRGLAGQDRSMREISDDLQVSPRTVTDLIDGLESRGLVARYPHPTDRRVTLLHLTEDGVRQLADARQHTARFDDAAVAGLTEADRQNLRALLARIAPGPAKS
jgi:DNA-binding MarR family transcriptional regulator